MSYDIRDDTVMLTLSRLITMIRSSISIIELTGQSEPYIIKVSRIPKGLNITITERD